ncbi:unnamed protein product [Phytomonas sp. Hart1]|nr:unnamed protein product [Phytomonas sp. Hart1]|eukprot:CCW67135.1 unnamed protein product [Phytomonas sp. isolate Hart1]
MQPQYIQGVYPPYNIQHQQLPPMRDTRDNTSDVIKEMFTCICNLYRPEMREKAILDLSKNRENYTVLGPTLWYSVGVMPIILQEIVSMYPLLSVSGQVPVKAAINRASSVLTLLQTVAQHEASRKPFLESQICLFLYPFLRVPPNERTEVLRLTSLGVIGALVKSDDPAVITYLLNTEIFPLCLRIMEQSVEISRIISTFILQKLLLSEQGLQYACQTPNRFTAVAEVLQFMVSEKDENGQHVCATRLLRHIIRCYLRLSENERAREALPKILPEELRNNTFHQYLEKDTNMKKWLLQLLVNIGDEGAKRINEIAKVA